MSAFFLVGTTFANGGLLVSDLVGGGSSDTDGPCTAKSEPDNGILVSDLTTGIIVAGFTGILVSDLTGDDDGGPDKDLCGLLVSD